MNFDRNVMPALASLTTEKIVADYFATALYVIVGAVLGFVVADRVFSLPALFNHMPIIALSLFSVVLFAIITTMRSNTARKMDSLAESVANDAIAQAEKELLND